MIASLVGFAFDAGSGAGQLTGVFTALYVIGCLVAVLAVAQSGLFTAVIQPPLVLFVTVPGAYFLMHSGEIHGIKDLLINCGYPLIERFPLMFFTSAAVLLIGLARWYFGKSVRAAAPDEVARPAAKARSGGLSAKLSAFLGGAQAADAVDATGAPEATPRERRAADRRRARAAKPAADRTERGARPARSTAARSRHSRNTETEIIEPVADRPRRRRPRPDDEPSGSPAEPRRRARPTSREPREVREPRERRSSYDRDDTYDRLDRQRPPRPERPERPQRRSRYDDYEPGDPYSAGGSTHHPISRVRYRGGDETDDSAEYRPRRRAPRDADRWEYDI